MNKLYDILELCLQEIEQGADIDTVLFHYPDFADELRPILEASVDAKSMAVPAPSAEVVRRNRAKVLQQAAQMRESRVKSSRRIWFASLRRVTVTLTVVAALFVSGTNLVRAASTTLPGDNLYPVKRTWEDVLLLFTFNLQEREALEVEHENERLHEVRELFAEGRSEDVEFGGLVTSQNGNEWVISPGITVLVSTQTELRAGPIVVGSAVRVEGETRSDGVVLAERIEVLPPGATLPDMEDEHEGEKENNEGKNEQEQDNSGKGSEETEESDSDSEQKDESLHDGSSSDNSGSGSDSGDHSGSGSSSDDGNYDSSDDSGGDNSGSGGGGDD